MDPLSGLDLWETFWLYLDAKPYSFTIIWHFRTPQYTTFIQSADRLTPQPLIEIYDHKKSQLSSFNYQLQYHVSAQFPRFRVLLCQAGKTLPLIDHELPVCAPSLLKTFLLFLFYRASGAGMGRFTVWSIRWETVSEPVELTNWKMLSNICALAVFQQDPILRLVANNRGNLSRKSENNENWGTIEINQFNGISNTA